MFKPRFDKRPVVSLTTITPKHYDEILDIEKESFQFPLKKKELKRIICQNSYIQEYQNGIIIAEVDGKAVGFLFYEIHETELIIIRFAVAKSIRRQGVGSKMIKSLMEKSSVKTRRKVYVRVRESNLDAQLFFKSQGFKTYENSVLRRYYRDTGEDAYLMLHSLDNQCFCSLTSNRPQ